MGDIKSRTKIKNINELPKWFNLKNYLFASNLDAKGWYEQLFIRWFCYRTGLVEHTSSAIIDLIRQKPIIDITTNEEFEIIMRYSSSKFHSKIPSSVHLSTPRELILHSSSASPQQLEYAINYLAQNHLNSSIPYEGFIDEAITEIDKNTMINNIVVSFNSNLPERVLVQEFQNIVKNIKSKHPPEKKYYRKDYKKWIEYGILPYLDLQMWAYQNQKDITIKVLTEAVYFTGERNEEDMRKTTIITAESLLTDIGLAKLAAEFELEKSTNIAVEVIV